MEQFESRGFHNCLRLPEDLIFEILLRLPAKSVARSRCVSTTWLFISTDPSFILAHARRTPKSWLFLSAPYITPVSLFHNLLFSFSANDVGRNLDHISSDLPRSSHDGLVLFFRKSKLPTPYYVMNPLTGLCIDVPKPTMRECISLMLTLYYHRWTREYRLISLPRCKGPPYNHLDTEVLSLAGTCSWRNVKAKAPFVSLSNNKSHVFVNDRLYWNCVNPSGADIILVFDILKETFSLMELPFYGRETFTSFAVNCCLQGGLVSVESNRLSNDLAANSCLHYRLIDMEGILCCWIIYREKSCENNIKIDIWAAGDGDEKWKNTYSLCLVDECRWALCYPRSDLFLLDSCLCISEGELLFVFDGLFSGVYSLRWDLKSGKYLIELLPVGDNQLIYPALTYRETLVRCVVQ